MIVLMRSQPVTLLTHDPSPNQPGTVGTPVATSSHLHQSHEDMLEMRMQALLIILIAMLIVVDDGGLGTLPQL